MGQLEPCARESLGEGLRIFEEPARDLFVDWIEAQRQVGGQHGRLALLRRIVRIGDDSFRVLGFPLDRAGRAAGLHPLVLEQVVEEKVAPLRRRLGPGDFEAAADSVCAESAAVVADPAEALCRDVGPFRLRSFVRLRCCAVSLAEGVAACDQRDGLLVVHRHARKGFTNEFGGGQRIAVAVRTFRIDVDQAHFGGAERIVEFLEGPVREPGRLGTPVHVEIGLPDVLAAGSETEGAETHRLQRDIAGENEKVSPGNLLAVFLLDRPQQAARLVDVDVVRPGIERGEALLAPSAAAAAVEQAVSAGGVPGHPDELRAVVAEVGRPPVLRVGHQLAQVALQRLVVELLEFLAVIERRVQRIGFGGMLAQQIDTQLVRPPAHVLRAAARSVIHRAFAGAGALVVRKSVHLALRSCSVVVALFSTMTFLEVL